jgi:hypothetical protein
MEHEAIFAAFGVGDPRRLTAADLMLMGVPRRSRERILVAVEDTVRASPCMCCGYVVALSPLFGQWRRVISIVQLQNDAMCGKSE